MIDHGLFTKQHGCKPYIGYLLHEIMLIAGFRKAHKIC